MMTQANHASPEDDDDVPTWREIRHYLEAPRRRPLTVLVPWAVVFLLSVAALFVLPKKYESSTVILVESEKVPESFVPKVATEDASQNLWAIRPEILSRTRLERVLAETDPYPDITSRTAAVEVMQKAISINVNGNEGFTLAFIHRDPHKAQQVANRIATLFIEETVKAREEQVSGAVDFLETQVADARKELEKKDAALRRFREERMGRLPEQLQANLATMSMLQREIQSVEESLYFDREKHDALVRTLRQASEGSSGASTETSELADLRRQLAALRARRYTDEHPDVKSLRSRIARLQAQLASGPAEGDAAADPAADTADTSAELQRISLEIKSLEEKRDNLEHRIAAVRGNVEQTPRTEQELATITRDYDQLKENYTTLLNKQLEAQMAGRLEQRWKGDRFRILDPANLPERPVSPKRWLVLGLGAFLGLFAGLGVCLGAELLDPTIKDAEDVRNLLAYPILACIPHHPEL
jgi:polysaccharide chain length determinant protein (PEP-CTERM system associated)